MTATLPVALTIACVVSVLALLLAQHRGSVAGRVIAKMAASSCFVGVALSLGALQTGYGQLILAALVLGWLGDGLLLFTAPQAFLAGLGAFLLSHLLFAAAFVSGEVSGTAVAVAMPIALGVGIAVQRWLRPHTPADFKGPVLAYVVVILMMCVAAAGHAVAADHAAVLVGAVMFAASDLSVARERFVREGFINQLWGWPAYFVAQLILAWTVAHASAAAVR